MSYELPPDPSVPSGHDPYAPPAAPTYGTPPPAYGQQAQPSGYPPPPAGYPAPGYGYAQQTSGKATAVLVLGILSLVFCMILGIIALAMAPGARTEIAMSQGRLTGQGQIKAGVICSWISIGLAIVGIIAFVALIAVGVSVGGSSN